MMNTATRILLVACLLLLGTTASSTAQSPGVATNDLPQYEVKDASAGVVTQGNLLASERFWPYRVSLIGAFKPEGRERSLKAGDAGVLVRVENSDVARIDFGRDGIFEVPVAKTDLVELSDRIRRGDALKKAPNFTLAIGPRLVSSDAPTLVPLLFRKALEYRGFLTVFADPDSDAFPQIAAELAPLRQRQGVLTILFPLSKHTDGQIRDRLRALEWPVAFVYDHLAESYLASLIPEGMKPPLVMLQTREGRVLFQDRWRPDIATALRSMLDRDFPEAPVAASPKSEQVSVPDRSEESPAIKGAHQQGDDSKP